MQRRCLTLSMRANSCWRGRLSKEISQSEKDYDVICTSGVSARIVFTSKAVCQQFRGHDTSSSASHRKRLVTLDVALRLHDASLMTGCVQSSATLTTLSLSPSKLLLLVMNMYSPSFQRHTFRMCQLRFRKTLLATASDVMSPCDGRLCASPPPCRLAGRGPSFSLGFFFGG